MEGRARGERGGESIGRRRGEQGGRGLIKRGNVSGQKCIHVFGKRQANKSRQRLLLFILKGCCCWEKKWIPR